MGHLPWHLLDKDEVRYDLFLQEKLEALRGFYGVISKNVPSLYDPRVEHALYVRLVGQPTPYVDHGSRRRPLRERVDGVCAFPQTLWRFLCVDNMGRLHFPIHPSDLEGPAYKGVEATRCWWCGWMRTHYEPEGADDGLAPRLMPPASVPLQDDRAHEYQPEQASTDSEEFDVGPCDDATEWESMDSEEFGVKREAEEEQARENF